MNRPTRGSTRRLAILVAAFVGAAIAWWVVAGQPQDAAESDRPVVEGTHESQPTPRFELDPNERLGEARPLEPSSVPRSPMPAPADLKSTLIVGKVLRPDGQAVPGAHIVVANTEHAMRKATIVLLPSEVVEPPAVKPVLTTDRYGTAIRGSAGGDGSIRIPLDAQSIGLLGGGTLLVAAVAEGRDVALQACGPLTTGETRLGDIVLPICAGLRLRVAMPAGDRPTEATVRVISPADSDEPPALGESWLGSRWVPEDGVVAIGGQLPGAADVRVDAVGARLARLPDVKLVAGEWAELGEVLLVAGASIAGVVVTADGSPLPDAQLEVLAESEPAPERLASLETLGRRSQWVRIAPDGSFEATGLDPGSHSLLLRVPGYATAILEGVQSGRRDVELVLQRPGVILLTLLDASTGAAIEGAEITVSAPPKARVGLFMVPAPDALIEAGPEHGLAGGLYRIVGAAPGGTHLTVRAKGFATTPLDAPPLAPESQWTAHLSLVRGLVVRGRVVDLGDRPIVEAQVQLASREESLANLETSVASIDAEGRFEFVDLPAGNWVCWAGASGYFSSPSVELALHYDLEDVLVRLTPEARIEGRVLAADGALAEGCNVACVMLEPALLADRAPYTPQLLVESSVRERGSSAVSVQDGRYALDSLAPGVHLIGAARLAEEDFEAWVEAWAASANDPSAELPDGVQRVVLGVGERRELDLVELPVATLRGRVLAGGAPAAGATVMLGSTSSADSEWIASAACDASGSYELGPLSPGQVLALASAEGELIPRVQLVDLAPGGITTADFEFVGKSVRGVTIDHVSRQPVADVPLGLSWTPPEEASTGIPTAAIWELVRIRPFRRPVVESGPAGRFEFRHLPPGRYSTSLQGTSWVPKVMPRFIVDDTWSGDELAVEVSTGSVVEGRFNVAGAGFDQASRHYEVGLYHPTENTVYKFADVEGGKYRLQGLHAGSYALRVRRMDAGGGAVFEQPIELAENDVRRVDIVVED